MPPSQSRHIESGRAEGKRLRGALQSSSKSCPVTSTEKHRRNVLTITPLEPAAKERSCVRMVVACVGTPSTSQMFELCFFGAPVRPREEPMANPILRLPGESLRDWKSSSKSTSANSQPSNDWKVTCLIQPNMAFPVTKRGPTRSRWVDLSFAITNSRIRQDWSRT